ncbi:ABC transporter permease [Microbacterium memoriense]|uniref:ABC transporter permease n=1 Tax=Microbacterium memoriense TaxID=2978350 RepID=A0ABT2PCY5_9MICO|nr:ABC transporter permease [Microbacterium memoriense]MCT9002448.1 ABC transporter permease [Microbacterium memoriense]
MNVFADFLNSGIRLTTPILFAALASLISARVGVLNLAIESKVLGGAFVGILVGAATGNPFIGVIAAALTGAVIGAIMAGAHRIGVDLVVLAIGLNILVLQLTVFVMRSYLDGVGTFKPDVAKFPPVEVPFATEVPFLDHLLAHLNWMVYVAFLLVAVVAVWFRTRSGRHLLAVGEAPTAAASAGLKVGRTQLWALVAAGAVAGLGGAFLSIGDLGLFTRNMSADRGWIGITAALLALNKPGLLIPAAAVFGLASAASIRLQQFDVPANLTQFIPQGAAFVALVLVGVHATSRGRFIDLWNRSTRIRLRRPPRPPAAAGTGPDGPPPSATSERTTTAPASTH